MSKSKFSKEELAFLRDIKQAKKLVEKNFSGMNSDALCDAMMDAKKALQSIVERLEPGAKQCSACGAYR